MVANYRGHEGCDWFLSTPYLAKLCDIATLGGMHQSLGSKLAIMGTGRMSP